MALTARGVIARTPGAAAEVEEFTIDDPGPNEVLVRILASGVCHTDLGVKMGTYGTSGFPFLLGHEGAGVVEAIGAGVEIAVGRRLPALRETVAAKLTRDAAQNALKVSLASAVVDHIPVVGLVLGAPGPAVPPATARRSVPTCGSTTATCTAGGR